MPVDRTGTTGTTSGTRDANGTRDASETHDANGTTTADQPTTGFSVLAVARPLVPVAIGGAVAVTLGAYGRLHEPGGVAVDPVFFSGLQAAKVWLTSAATLIGVAGVLAAVAVAGRLPGVAPKAWITSAHRWCGRLAFLISIPVAVHCLYALGFQFTDTRMLVHSALGCVFFGAFTVKMQLLTRPATAGWMLPLAGGVLFAVLIGVWLTSSLWFFETFGVRR